MENYLHAVILGDIFNEYFFHSVALSIQLIHYLGDDGKTQHSCIHQLKSVRTFP